MAAAGVLVFTTACGTLTGSEEVAAEDVRAVEVRPGEVLVGDGISHMFIPRDPTDPVDRQWLLEHYHQLRSQVPAHEVENIERSIRVLEAMDREP